MADQSLFQEEKNPLETPTPQSPVSPTNLFADQLKTIVDESGRQKYESPEKALEALRHSQSYIPQLKGQLTTQEQEIERLKAELEKRQSVEDLIASRLAPQEPEPASPVQTAGLDEQAVLKLLDQTLTQTKDKDRRATNLASVESALVSKFGDKAKEALSAKATELGVGIDQLKAMAEDTPQLVHALFGSVKPPSPQPVHGGQHISAQPAPVDTLEQRLAEAERKILTSGINRSNQTLITQLRADAMAKYGITE